MLDKLSQVEKRFEQVGNDLQNPDLASNQSKYRTLMKEYADLKEVVDVYREFKKVKEELSTNKGMLAGESDESMREMIRADLSDLERRNVDLNKKLELLLIPKDPNDDKNIILEIRPGAGGDESALFTEELYRAYTLYAAKKGWKVSPLNIAAGNVGGFKEVIVSITGEKVYSHMKYESGVHRVQRVPKTEASGRVHTSTVTVAVLPEADDVDVKIDAKDLRVDVMRASGAGGQSVNRTESAVRLTHLPTNVVVYCQEGKSQTANKETAMKILFSRLLALEEEKARQSASDARLAQIGTGDRSERIRTYNFPQSRITDHRIGHTIHQISSLMEGELDLMIQPLATHYQAEALKHQEKS